MQFALCAYVGARTLSTPIDVHPVLRFALTTVSERVGIVQFATQKVPNDFLKFIPADRWWQRRHGYGGHRKHSHLCSSSVNRDKPAYRDASFGAMDRITTSSSIGIRVVGGEVMQSAMFDEIQCMWPE